MYMGRQESICKPRGKRPEQREGREWGKHNYQEALRSFVLDFSLSWKTFHLHL